MEPTKTHSDSSSQMFLTGVILLANMDFSGLLDYAIKALIGGVIWVGFKLGADFLSSKWKIKK